jgi:hypothetical protein
MSMRSIFTLTMNKIFIQGLVHMGSQVPSPKFQVPLMLASPDMKAKSQLLSLKISLKYGWFTIKSNLDYCMQKYSRDLCWELGLAFCSTQLSTQVPTLASQKCCHVGIHVILGTWDLGLGTPVWTGWELQILWEKWQLRPRFGFPNHLILITCSMS